MSKAARIFPLIAFFLGTTSVLAVDLDLLSEAMNRPQEGVFQCLGDYAQDENHCRQEADQVLISPVAALSIVEKWRAPDEDSSSVKAELESYLYPLAEVALGGFNEAAQQPPAEEEYTLTFKGRPELVAELGRVGSRLEQLYQQVETGGVQPAVMVAGLEYAFSQRDGSLELSEEKQLEDGVEKALARKYRLHHCLLDATKSWTELVTFTTQILTDPLLERVVDMSKKNVEVMLTEQKEAEAALLMAQNKLESFRLSQEALEPVAA